MSYLRKVLKIGNSSLFITLPKPWCERFGIKEGEHIEIFETSAGELLIAPPKVHEKEKPFEVKITEKNKKYLEKVISYFYINGFNKLTIYFSNKEDFELAKKIAESKFIGLILTSQSNGSAEFEFALDINKVNFIELVRRMDRITSSMSSYINNKDKLVDLDLEVDKIYFLLIRMLRTGLTNSEVSKKLAFTPVKYLDFRLVLHFIETFGDEIVRLSGKIKQEDLEIIIKLKERSLSAFLGNSDVSPDEIEQLTKKAEEIAKMYEPETRTSFIRMVEMAKDIADLSETLYL